MSKQTNEGTPIEGEEFTLSREFNASREVMFQVWTDPKHLAKWWGPKGFTMKTVKMDLRPGGIFHYCMTAPAGHPMGGEMWGKFVYREIVKPEKIVFVNSFSDANAGTTRHPMAPNWPLEMLNTQTFTEKNGKTTVNLRSVSINSTDEERRVFKQGHASMTQGFGGTFDQLEAYLKTL